MKRKRLLPWLLAAGWICLGVLPKAAAQDTAMRLGIGDAAPDFSLEEIASGQPVSLGDYLGKRVVMLDFWATSCPICVAEIPQLVRQYERYEERGFTLLGITLSRGDAEDRRKIQSLKEEHAVGYPLLMDIDFQMAAKTYGLSGPIPLKVVIDCGGVIRYAHVGISDDGANEVPSVLEELLKDPACRS